MLRCPAQTVCFRLIWVCLLVVLSAGCTRNFFRNRADRDVEDLLNEKNRDERWGIENWYIYADPRARYADTDKPDRPNKPPDDPGVAAVTPNPQPIRSWLKKGQNTEGGGYVEYLEKWDAQNRAERSQRTPPVIAKAEEKPAPKTSIDTALETNEAPFLLTLEQANELSLFNSREFMDRREDLYVSALPVTLERFSFVSQFFFTEQAVREWTGRQTADGTGSRWRLNSTARANQLLPTGATLVTQLANRLVIDLTNNRPSVGISNFTLALTQPFLQGGGWAVTMEPLTQAERNLVYGIRSYARFRKNYYVYIAGGADVFNSPYAYAGLNLRGVGPNLTAPSQGYLPTILSSSQERNERENIKTLVKYLDLFREYQGKGDFSELQVGQVEQQLLRGQSSLLQRRQELQNGLDQFKLQLGIPTRTPLELDDGPVQPINDMFNLFNEARDDFLNVREEADRFVVSVKQPLSLLAGGLATTRPIELPVREKFGSLLTDSPLVRKTTDFKKTIRARWMRWQEMTTDQIKEDIRKLNDELRNLRVEQARAEARGDKLSAEQDQQLNILPKEVAIGSLELSLRNYEGAAKKKGATARDASAIYEEAINNLMLVLGEARKERQQMVRQSIPDLPKVVIEGTDVIKDDLDRAQTLSCQMALGNRIDLMNARGQLNDSWRRIAVEANSLLGVFNVGYQFDSPSPAGANEPLAIGGPRSRHQLILTGELPLVRREERNRYRTALIAYQRNRRNVQATEDFILNDVRTNLRQLRVLAENYRIQLRALEVAYDQVENALDVLQAPPVPTGGGAQPGGAAAQNQQQAANAASLTLQLLNAQGSLLQAQNSLYTTWVNYLIARMTFYRDIEQLPLDPRGVWIDDEPATTGPNQNRLSPGQRPSVGGFAELR